VPVKFPEDRHNKHLVFTYKELLWPLTIKSDSVPRLYIKEDTQFIDKIFLEKLSSDNKIDNIINRYGVFDIIIDNGCYYYDGIFESLFPCMKDDGIYIVNKIKTEYFNKYIKYLNTSDDIDFIKDPYKINKTTENVFEKTIDKIEFGCGFIIIHKKNRDHWQLVKQ